jgi:hypothetical protein
MNRKALVLVFASLLLIGCGDLFSVANPTNLTDDDLKSPELLDALGNTPEGEFSDGYDLAVIGVALVSDEGFHVTTQTDALNLMAGVMDGWNLRYEEIYNRLSAARWIADDVTQRLEGLVQNPTADHRVANGYFWGAIGRITMADLFEAVTIDGGPALTPAKVYEGAIERLITAANIARAAGSPNLEAAANGAIARAYRSLYFERGRDLSALERAREYALQALAIKDDYAVDVHYQQPGKANGIISRFNEGPWDALDPRYANLTDPVSGGRDPRIKHGPRVTASIDGRDVYLQLKYPDRDADIPLSRWQDARLILAEYYLVTGDLPAAVGEINAVRRAISLADFTSNDADEVFRQLQYERIAEFWLEARRWQDMRYWGVIPPDWAPEQKSKGIDRRWPISDAERASNSNLD